MSGVIAGCLTGLSVALLVAGTVAGLVLADVPPGVIIAVGLGLPGLPLAGLALREYLRFRGQFRSRRRLRSRPLTGWRLTSAALASAALGTGSAVAGFRGPAAGSAVLAVLAASLAARCAVAAWTERKCPHLDPWTTGELAALDDEASLEQLLLATDARREGKFR